MPVVVAILTIVGLLVGTVLVIAAPILLAMQIEMARMGSGMEAVRKAIGHGTITTWKYARWRLPILDAKLDDVTIRIAVEPLRSPAYQAVGAGVPMKVKGLGAHITVRPPSARASDAESAVEANDRLRFHEGVIEGWGAAPKGERSRRAVIDLAREALSIARGESRSTS